MGNWTVKGSVTKKPCNRISKSTMVLPFLYHDTNTVLL